jgi:hypothetical protein
MPNDTLAEFQIQAGYYLNRIAEKDRVLLVLGCSRRKNTDLEIYPALARYDGNLFRVVRNTVYPVYVDILIISAKYGLLLSSSHISTYDQQMTHERALELRPEITAKWNAFGEISTQKGITYKEIMIGCGKEYRFAANDFNLEFFTPIDSPVQTITILKGLPGRQMADLKAWLISLEGPNTYQPETIPSSQRSILSYLKGG